MDYIVNSQPQQSTTDNPPIDPDDHDWYSIRIHSSDVEDIEASFKHFVEDQSIDRYLLCYEDDVARPHYHSLIECSLQKKKQIKSKKMDHFKKHFTSLEGNKSYAWTACYGPQRMFQYICKGGDYRLYSIHFTPQILEEFKSSYWKEQALTQQKKSINKQKDKQDKKKLEDKFITKCTEISHMKFKRENYYDLIEHLIIENNISTTSETFHNKYYALYLKTLDLEAYENFIKHKIKQYNLI